MMRPVSDPTRVDVLGCPVDAMSLRETVASCLSLIDNGGGRQVSVNASKVVLCEKNPELADALGRAEIVSADGVPIVWASKLLGDPIPGRVNGTDLMEALMQVASDRGLRIYILGASTAVLHRASARISERYPGLVVAGTQHGYFAPQREDQVVEQINDAKPDMLFLAMGSPHKEFWLDRNWERLDVGFAMGVGGSIDVIAGRYPRAPRWMQRAGLEWLHRLALEPRRMWRRYLVGNTNFLRILLSHMVRRRLGFGG